jgi:hypothetical protein
MGRIAPVIIVALIACSPEDQQAKPVPQSPPATAKAPPPPPPKPTPTAPAPSALPFCASDPANEPLAALCRIGGPIEKAHFDCAKPQALAFCTKRGNLVTWACRRENPPPITFHALGVWPGPPVQSGDTIDLSKYKPEGTLHGVSVHLKTPKATGTADAEKLTKRFVELGCLVTDNRATIDELACGGWDVHIAYHDIIEQVIVDAAEHGHADCL